MANAEKFSDRNVKNSIAVYIADKLLVMGYLVYWSNLDAVQTNAGWYYQYTLNYATYLLDATFSAAITSAKGLVTLVDTLPAAPRFVARPINDGSAPPADVVAIPALSIEIGAATPVRNYEVGTTNKWRLRALIVDGFFRNEPEQKQFQDALMIWFDHDLVLDILDHEAGTLSAVGIVTVRGPSVDTETKLNDTEATTYETLLHTQLEYVA